MVFVKAGTLSVSISASTSPGPKDSPSFFFQEEMLPCTIQHQQVRFMQIQASAQHSQNQLISCTTGLSTSLMQQCHCGCRTRSCLARTCRAVHTQGSPGTWWGTGTASASLCGPADLQTLAGL